MCVCPVLPFLPFSGERQGKPTKRNKDFLVPVEALKSLEKKGEKKTRSSSQGTKTRTSRKKQGKEGQGGVRFGYGLGVERLEQFPFSVNSVPAAHLQKKVVFVSVQFNRRDGWRFRFLETQSAQRSKKLNLDRNFNLDRKC